MSNPDLIHYRALLAEAATLARSLFWRVTLSEETVDGIAKRLRSLLAGRAFTVTEDAQVSPHCHCKSVVVGRCAENAETWVDLSVWLENGPHYTFSTAAYSMYSTPVLCFGPQAVMVERVKRARPPYGYPQRITFAVEEA